MVRVIRWVGESSGKKYIHPIERCIHDGGNIKKVIGTKTKVIGITKVHIPNPLHPIVPYNVLILEDEHGHRMPKKTIKDYCLGDVYEDIPNAGDNAIAAVRIKYDVGEAVDEALELIGGLAVSKKQKILLKPNLSIPGYPYLGICTNPQVIRAVISYLVRKGAEPKNITIAEQSFFMPLEKAVEKSGIAEIITEFGVNYADLAKGGFIVKKEREFTFEIAKAVYETGLLINLPVIKTDTVLGIDGAFENLTRFLSKKAFDELAKNPLKAGLALATFPHVFPPFITVGDASIGMQGNGPAMNGEPGFFNLIFAARNPVVHDTAIQEALCLKKLPYVELAGTLGYGTYEIENISFVGNELDAIRRDIKQPIGSKLIQE
ncbi:TPA: DUF362 domain-containing protein [Candidatus Woesearchaeota archaeon]|nr:DUF362 domain-containing protein [Candidatus Woesearchaeota archaeon]HII68351.1 DUF362 domain-containing protein [Candidatus Woesearchaeota archaeon]